MKTILRAENDDGDVILGPTLTLGSGDPFTAAALSTRLLWYGDGML